MRSLTCCWGATTSWHSYLQSSDTCRRLEPPRDSQTATSNPHVSVTETLRWKRLRYERFADAGELAQPAKQQPGTYAMPTSLTYAGIDGIAFPESGSPLLIQCTISAVHEIKSEVVQTLDALASKPRFTFAVPARVLTRWNRCQAVVSGKRIARGESSERAEAWLNEIKDVQWVLVVPDDHLAFPALSRAIAKAVPVTASPAATTATGGYQQAAAAVQTASQQQQPGPLMSAARNKRGPVKGSHNMKTCKLCRSAGQPHDHHWTQCPARQRTPVIDQ